VFAGHATSAAIRNDLAFITLVRVARGDHGIPPQLPQAIVDLTRGATGLGSHPS
jgi:hypothetical protein